MGPCPRTISTILLFLAITTIPSGVRSQPSPQQFSIGYDALPETVEINAQGDMALTQSGERVLEKGQFFISRDSGNQPRERLTIVAARRVEIPNERPLMPVPLPPLERNYAVEFEARVFESGRPTDSLRGAGLVFPSPTGVENQRGRRCARGKDVVVYRQN